MATRCEIAISDRSGQIKAKLYRHSDGYPDRVFGDLTEDIPAAFEKLKKAGRHFNAESLASMLVVSSVGSNGVPGIVPCQDTHGDVAYRYIVRIQDESTVSVEVGGDDRTELIELQWEPLDRSQGTWAFAISVIVP